MKTKVMDERGFTLIEVMVAVVLLAIGILGVTKLQLSFIQSNVKSNMVSVGSAQAQGLIEQMLELDFDHAWFDDDDGDGTGEDLNDDGVDDDGGNFGLDDVGGGADGNATLTSPDGKLTFNCYWNVAVDQPADGAKTVKVIVQWNDETGTLRTVSYSFVKANIANF